MTTALRLIWAGVRFHVKSLTMSGFFILTSVLQPIIFASLAFFMFEAGAKASALLYVSLGAGLMGIWSSVLFGSGGAIQWQRWQGTLEVGVAAPPPFVLVLLPITLSTSVIGLYSLTATLLWGRIFFGVPFNLEQPALFVLAIPVTVVGLGMLGLVLASTFVLYRHASALSNLLEYPIWLVTGLLVEVSLLPTWSHPIGWLLAPKWGIDAMRSAAFGGDALGPIAICVALSLGYFALGWYFVGKFERLARKHATLSLT